MGSFTTEIRIDAPVNAVWAVLADIGEIYRWNPGVVSSHLTTDTATDVGASRYCDLGGNNYLDEKVVEWEEGQRLTMRIVRTNLPFKTADIRFKLRADNGATVVSVSPDYRLKFSLLGTLLDQLYVRRTYAKGMKALLTGLKHYIESGQQP
ncbi:MAG: SRPBCC family protein [Anaerolineae bacterium]